MEVTTKEKESENRIINASIGVIISLALMYLANKYSFGEYLLEKMSGKNSKSFENILKIKSKFSDFIIFKDSYLFLYLLVLVLILYGIMIRGKNNLQASQFQANMYLIVSGICFGFLQFSNNIYLDCFLMFWLALIFRNPFKCGRIAICNALRQFISGFDVFADDGFRPCGSAGLDGLQNSQMSGTDRLGVRSSGRQDFSQEPVVRGEPLRRVHECVFGVLALESEPVDPRL